VGFLNFMAKKSKIALLTLVLTSLFVFQVAIAAEVGVAVKFSTGEVSKKCVNISEGSTGYQVILLTGLNLVWKDYGGGLGHALCKIENTGCPESNCFCSSEYWNFLYKNYGQNWSYSNTGLDGYSVQDKDILGLVWGEYGASPPEISFGEICSVSSGGGPTPKVYTEGKGYIRPTRLGRIKKIFGSGAWVQVDFPEETTSEVTTVTITPQDKEQIIESHPLPKGKQIVGDLIARFQAFTNKGPLESFKKKIIVQFNNIKDFLSKLGEFPLSIYQWNEELTQWQSLETRVNTYYNFATAQTGYFSYLALMVEKVEEQPIGGQEEEELGQEPSIEELEAKKKNIQLKIIESLKRLIRIYQQKIQQLSSS
jgi:hypothetical protein